MNKIEQMKKVIDDFYKEMLKIEKPKNYKVGGTYYGGTQLFSSVGNHLDKLDDEDYYNATYRIQYVHTFGVRVGGAYEVSSALREVEKKLMDIMGCRYDNDTYIGIFYNYGTNFSTIGFGTIVH